MSKPGYFTYELRPSIEWKVAAMPYYYDDSYEDDYDPETYTYYHQHGNMYFFEVDE